MWKTILERLKSPVVIGQVIISAFALATVITGVSYESLADRLVMLVTALAAVFAAMNNPTTPKFF